MAYYLEVDSIQILHRKQTHWFKECYTMFLKQQSKQNDLTFQQYLQQHYPTESMTKTPHTSSRLNLYGVITTKSSILTTKGSSGVETPMFFVRINCITGLEPGPGHGAGPGTITFVLFYGTECLRWYHLLDVGMQYLMANLKTNHQMTGSGSRYPNIRLLQCIKETQYFMYSGDQVDGPLGTFNQQSIQQQSSLQTIQTMSTIHYTGMITSDYLANEGCYKIDEVYRLFFTHFSVHNTFIGHGLHQGTRITLHNAHPIIVNKQLIGFGMCTSSSFKFDGFQTACTSVVTRPQHDVSELHRTLSRRYSIIDTFVLIKIFGRLMIKFPATFKDSSSFLSDRNIIDSIAGTFNIAPQTRGDNIERVFGHDTKCVAKGQSCATDYLFVVKISEIPRPRYKPGTYMSKGKYSLIGQFEMVQQDQGWGLVAIKDGAGPSSLLCHVIGVSLM
ncbi:hypothetical protein SAMD00019534_093330 [Acytostelium subglobosum LB1]|uniref:hypothetical protein n=1 Tax=Acytostelium subglobosum LB1 TaxID=1410327 RepID=UPI000644816C|nr:hypothetical protein SAMD00019534_093330 [Acytostelium subglobosum LB1]GAM26158.1 hypothetical protein SAMD00019534_093330 [Acytostelium subglobosum LB1]|eukprot:XP_012750712.1 hypothetical protein SAMD00019534_093330 [Acytostelium subglobosum LB1]